LSLPSAAALSGRFSSSAELAALSVDAALSAGAGSGKTSVLSERIVETLLQGVAPSSVAAITFTEKAAGELVVRVRDALERRLQLAMQIMGPTLMTQHAESRVDGEEQEKDDTRPLPKI